MGGVFARIACAVRALLGRRDRLSAPSAPGPTEEDDQAVENVANQKMDVETSVTEQRQSRARQGTEVVEQAARNNQPVPTHALDALANDQAEVEENLQREMRHLTAQGQLATAVVASKEEDALRYPCPDFLKGFESSGFVNLAVVGGRGVGKSSFINAIRGLKKGDPAWAKTGAVETTMEPTMFEMSDPYFGCKPMGDYFVAGNLFLLKGDGPATASFGGADSAAGDTAAERSVRAVKALGRLCTMRGHAEDNKIRVQLLKNEEEMVVSKEELRPTSGVLLWDLPGVGTLNFPQETYIQDMGIRYFDVVLLMNDQGFTEAENLVVRELKAWEVPLFAIRNKIDDAIRSQLQAELDEDEDEEMEANVLTEEHIKTVALGVWEACRRDLLNNSGTEHAYLIATLPRMRDYFDFRLLCRDLLATARARRSRFSDNQCPVCLEEYEQRPGADKSCVAWRSCSHLFCRSCASQVSTCPLCRLPKVAPSAPPPEPRLPLHLLSGAGVSPPSSTRNSEIQEALDFASLLPPPFTHVPDRISLEWADVLQRSILQLSGAHIDDFFPEVVISYATGPRAGLDEPKTGPGMVYAAEFALRLHDAGIATFSGLSIPPGENWKIILLRVAGRRVQEGQRKPAKVLLVVETPAFYRSLPCLHEVTTAIENNVHILPVSLEKPKPRQNNMWQNIKGGDAETELMILQAARIMSTTNGLPPRQTLLDLPSAMGQIVDSIKGHISVTADASAALGAARVPQQHRAAE